jgi:hypothetical protein
MNWSAKLFLSVILFVLGFFSFFGGLLYLEELRISIKLFVFAIPSIFLLGFILGLLSVWRDKDYKTLAKGITFMHAIVLILIAYLYYDFATNFTLNLNIWSR